MSFFTVLKKECPPVVSKLSEREYEYLSNFVKDKDKEVFRAHFIDGNPKEPPKKSLRIAIKHARGIYENGQKFNEFKFINDIVQSMQREFAKHEQNVQLAREHWVKLLEEAKNETRKHELYALKIKRSWQYAEKHLHSLFSVFGPRLSEKEVEERFPVKDIDFSSAKTRRNDAFGR
jgi:hypothetical protein